MVVVGAGVLGASAAFHLASLGAKVTLLERESAPGRGSTGRAAGGFRAHYSTAIHIRLSLLSREKLLRFRDELGCDPGYMPAGYLWLARTAEELEELRAARQLQLSLGLDGGVDAGQESNAAEAPQTSMLATRMLTPAQAARLNPAIDLEGICGAAVGPIDGFIRPLEILRGYLEGALGAGGRLVQSAPVIGFDRARSGALLAARTAQGRFPAGAFVDAAGPWAAEVARLAGIELPVAPLRRQVAATAPTTALPAEMPMTIWMEDGFHLRVRDGRVLLLLPNPGDPRDPFDDSVEPAWLSRVARLARQRVPALAGVAIDPAQSWAGLYEMSPDRHAIVGAAPQCPNLYFINGSSGHGVMHAPALGQLLAEEIVLGKARTIDISALRYSRFAESDLNKVSGPL